MSDRTLITTAAIGVLANDQANGAGTLTAMIVSEPTHGTLSLMSDGSFLYTAETGFTGVDGFSYKAIEGALDSAIATVTIEVSPTITGPPEVNVTASVPDASQVGNKSGTFTFSRSGDLSAPLTVAYSVGGSADRVGGMPEMDSVTFAADVGTVSVPVIPLRDGDSQAAGDETVTVSLVADPLAVYTIKVGEATVTIHNDASASNLVAPGTTWNNGHDDGFGNWIEATVSVHNSGPGWLEVSSKQDGLHVAPGTPSSNGDYTLGLFNASPTSGVGGASYAFEVTGLAGTHSGDVFWSGSANSLTIKTTGDVAALGITGALAVDADGSVGSLSGGSVAVRAGGSIEGVTATGDISSVHAGGDILGPIHADGSIGEITAGAGSSESSSPLARPEVGLDVPLWTLDPESDQYIPADQLGTPPVVPGATGGSILGTVSAGGSIGAVTAFGAISADISAAGCIGQPASSMASGTGVWALGAIAANIHANQGSLTVRGWGTVSGRVESAGDLQVWSFGDLSADVLSGEGSIRAGTWGALDGTVTAAGAVDVRAAGDLGGANAAGTVTSGEALSAWAGGAIHSALHAAGNLAAFAVFAVNADATSDLKDTWVQSKTGNITGQLSAKGLVQATAGGDITGAYLESQSGNVIADAGGLVKVTKATAGQNLWVSARDGSVTGTLTAEEGWAYVWAMTDVNGDITAKQSASVTAWGDLKSTVKSEQDWVEAYAGKNVVGDLSGRWIDVEAQGDVSGKVTAGAGNTDGDAAVRAGGSVTGDVKSSGTVDVSSGKDITGDVTAEGGQADVSANGNVEGEVTSGAAASVSAGGNVAGPVSGKSSADVTAVADISGDVSSTAGNVSLHAGGNITGAVSAGVDASIQAVGAVCGVVTAKGNAAVLANGDITGAVTAQWVADVRSANGQVLATVTTIGQEKDRFTDPTSPWKKRIDALDAKIADLQQQKAASTDANAAVFDAQIADLQTEKELQKLSEQTTDLQKIPAERIRGMLTDGLAKEYDGDAIKLPNVWTLGLTNSTWEAKGYVVVADIVGQEANYMVLEPYKLEAQGLYGSSNNVAVSLLGQENPSRDAQFYKVSYRVSVPYSPIMGTPDEYRARNLTDDSVGQKVLALALRKQQAFDDSAIGTVRMGLSLVPLVGAVNDFIDGNYVDAGISLAGDVGMIMGWGAALKARQCVNAGRTAIKIASVTSTTVGAVTSAIRLGQGIDAYRKGDNGKALGYFGDATLRLLGLSATAVKWLKNKPKCFVGGTPVHTEGGVKAIEDVRSGERVWAFDRQAQEWRLCLVTRTFTHFTDSPLTMARLNDGDTLTGTTGHPMWVIEGESLASRGRPDHGADEPTGPTPGRWVPLTDLQSGDAVLCRTGKVAGVTGVRTLHAPQSVYNLEVQGLHSYAVGASGLLAHNAGGDECDKVLATASAAQVKGTAPTPHQGSANPVDTKAKPMASSKAEGPKIGVIDPRAGLGTPTAKGSQVPWGRTAEAAPAFNRKPNLPKGGDWLNADGKKGFAGESIWHSADGKYKVPYKDQFPVFQVYEDISVPIRMTGKRNDPRLDFSRANQALVRGLKPTLRSKRSSEFLTTSCLRTTRLTGK